MDAYMAHTSRETNRAFVWIACLQKISQKHGPIR
jgi:hypothetical protein